MDALYENQQLVVYVCKSQAASAWFQDENNDANRD